MPGKILLIDDDTLFRRSISLHLLQAGYKVKTASSAEDGLIISRDEPIDLVLLDVGLPGMDGLDALKYFNNEVGVPVIFVTARRRKLDEALGLELGADDYITKPFDTSVLLARIKAVLRRSQRTTFSTEPPNAFSVGDISIDPRTHTVEVKGIPVDLTPSEFKLLLTFAQDAEQIISSDDLLARVWGAEYIGQPQVVYVHLRGLRKKIEENPNRPKRIITVRGVGYKLVLQEAL